MEGQFLIAELVIRFGAVAMVIGVAAILAYSLGNRRLFFAAALGSFPAIFVPVMETGTTHGSIETNVLIGLERTFSTTLIWSLIGMATGVGLYRVLGHSQYRMAWLFALISLAAIVVRSLFV